jgi:hypothetical protein
MPPNPAAAPRNPRGRRQPSQRPRAIPGGYSIGRWPMTIALEPDESAHSWLTRVAARYGITPRQVLAELGAIGRPASARRVFKEIARHAEELGSALGQPESRVAAACSLSPLDRVFAAYLNRYHGTERDFDGAAKFCPQCLADSPYWRVEWSTPVHVVCVHHQVLLQARCPKCLQVPWSTIAWLSRASKLHCCPQRRDRTTTTVRRRVMPYCNKDFRKVERAEVDSEVVSAQQFILAMAELATHDPQAEVHAAGIAATPALVCDAFFDLVDEAVGGIDALLAAEYDPNDVARALRTAHRILTLTDPLSAASTADEAGVLNPTGSRTPIGPPHVFAVREHSPILAAIRLSSMAETFSPAAQLMFRTATGHSPRYPRIPTSGPLRTNSLPEHYPDRPEITPAWVPQVLWSGALWESSSVTADLGPAAQALVLARIGDTRPWRLIALDLGLPARLAHSVPMYWRRVARAGEWPSARDTLIELSEQLRADPPPIDYQIRRLIADDPLRITRAVHSAVADGSSTRSRTKTGVLVRRFWELFTGGDVTYARAPFGITVPSEYAVYRLAADQADRECGSVFDRAHAILSDPDRPAGKGLHAAGPLTWRPP